MSRLEGSRALKLTISDSGGRAIEQRFFGDQDASNPSKASLQTTRNCAVMDNPAYPASWLIHSTPDSPIAKAAVAYASA